MPLISVTLDVSKCSDWLNAIASRNMAPMSLKLDVSKCSDRLNAIAPRNMSDMSVTLNEGGGDGSPGQLQPEQSILSLLEMKAQVKGAP